MATKKPIAQVILENETYNKLEILKQKQKRKSISQVTGFIIEDWIENYEQQHGPITLPTASEKANPEDERA